MSAKSLLFIPGVIFLISCSSNTDDGKLLAEVNDAKLYQSDLEHLFSSARYSVADSIAIVNDYVDSWVEEQILVQEAEKSDKVDMDAIEERAKRFKNQLIIHEMIKSEMDVKLDTNVTMAEIQKYYNSHPEEFQLNDYLVKVLYMKVPFDAPDIEKISYSYKLYGPRDLQEIETYAPVYASNFYYDAENWIYFDDLLKEIPLHDINKDRFIMKRSKIRFEEAGHYYFLNIIDYKLKNTLSPVEFEKDNIRQRILSMRVKDLQNQIRNDLIQKARNEGKIEIYE